MTERTVLEPWLRTPHIALCKRILRADRVSWRLPHSRPWARRQRAQGPSRAGLWAAGCTTHMAHGTLHTGCPSPAEWRCLAGRSHSPECPGECTARSGLRHWFETTSKSNQLPLWETTGSCVHAGRHHTQTAPGKPSNSHNHSLQGPLGRKQRTARAHGPAPANEETPRGGGATDPHQHHLLPTIYGKQVGAHTHPLPRTAPATPLPLLLRPPGSGRR